MSEKMRKKFTTYKRFLKLHFFDSFQEKNIITSPFSLIFSRHNLGKLLVQLCPSSEGCLL